MAILILTLTILFVDKFTVHNSVLIPTHCEIIGLTDIVKKETGAA